MPDAPALPLGLFIWFGIPVPFAERARMVREAGFTHTALWWEEQNPERRAKRHLAPAILREAGLEIDNLHVPFRGCNALWDPDPAEQAVTRLHEGWIADCATHGVPRMVMHITQGTSCPPPNPAGLDRLRRLADHAAERGVTLALENTRSPAHLDAVFEAMAHPALGLCFDTSHDRLYADTPAAFLRRWSHRLVCTHFSDTDGRRDQHWLPGKGVVDFDAVARAMDWRAWPGVLMLEVVPAARDADPEAFLAEAHAVALRLRDQLLAPPTPGDA